MIIIMSGLTAPTGSAEVESWCRVGFIEFQRGNSTLSKKARKNLHNHLCKITQNDEGLPSGVQQKLKAINQSLREEFPLSYCHHFPIQGFLRISQCLISIEDANQFPPLKDIARVQGIYRNYLRDNKAADTSRNHDTRSTTPLSHLPLRGDKERQDKKCSWAKRLCQTLWNSL